jgi:hypothetical protein
MYHVIVEKAEIHPTYFHFRFGKYILVFGMFVCGTVKNESVMREQKIFMKWYEHIFVL